MGIQPEYVDNWGQTQTAAPELKAALLRALGVPTSTTAEINGYLRQRFLLRWTRLFPATLVTGQSPEKILARASAEIPPDARLRVTLTLESGARETGDWRWGDLAIAGHAHIGGRHFVARQLDFRPPLPLGYHRVTAELEGQHEECYWIVAPERVWDPGGDWRAAGVAISLYGLRSQRNQGCGDFTDLQNFARWAGQEFGAALIGLNPLHAIHNRQPFNTSPYLPVSAWFRNPLYLDLESIPELRDWHRARRLLARPAIQAELKSLRDSEFVEYERVWRLKRIFLRLAYQHRRPEFDTWYREQAPGLLERFSTYCALDRACHAADPNVWNWPAWPAEFRRPDTAAVRTYSAEHEDEIRFYAFLQFLIDEQLAAAQQAALDSGVRFGLYHDLALATDSGGADTWMFPELYVPGCRVGAPPDGFSPEGQDWGFPPPDHDAHARQGYQVFRELIRRNARHGGALRFDHVMRFFRLYWIPQGFTAKHGAYVSAPAEDLLRIIALESHRHQFLVIGEDLGTITGEIRALLDRFGIFGYRLLYFERDGENFRPASAYPERAVAAITTHDLPTFDGFWQNTDIEARHAAGLLPDAESYQRQKDDRARDHVALRRLLDGIDSTEPLAAALSFLNDTPSKLMIVNQEEITREVYQQNLPGSTAEYPNWRRKMKLTLEELASSGRGAAFRDLWRKGKRA